VPAPGLCYKRFCSIYSWLQHPHVRGPYPRARAQRRIAHAAHAGRGGGARGD